MLRNRWKSLMFLGALSLLTLLSSAAAQAYVYVGSYWIADPRFAKIYTDNPICYTPQEAAALIFGGVASDYAISTNSSKTDPSTINFLGWVDGYGDASHTKFNGGEGGTPVSQSYKKQTGTGYNDPGGNQIGSAYSALVYDHEADIPDDMLDQRSINYVWHIGSNPVPEPGTVALLVAGGIGAGTLLLRRRNRK